MRSTTWRWSRRGSYGYDPFFSPDGQWIGFYDTTTGVLQKISILGGSPVMLTQSEHAIRGASWGSDDQIIYGTESAGLFRVSGAGGEPEALTSLNVDAGETSHTWPFVLPEERGVLFVASPALPQSSGQLAVLDLTTAEIRRLGIAGFSPVYVATGHLVYADIDGTLNAVPFDAATLDVAGDPVPLTESTLVKSSGAANFSVSNDGRLTYVASNVDQQRSDLAITNRNGLAASLAEIDGVAWYPRFSLDGTRVAYGVSPGPGGELVVSSGGGEEAVWAPDGTELFYRNGDQLMVAPVSTSGTPTAGAPLPAFVAPFLMDTAAGGAGNPNYDISPDGEQFLFVDQDSAGTAPDITVVLNWHQELLERVPVD